MRTLLWLVILLLLAGCSSGYKPGTYGSQRVEEPAEYARRAIPGWARAEQEGLVVALDRTFAIPDTDARVRLDAVWYSPLRTYVLYTTTGSPFMATWIETDWGIGMGDWGPNPYWHGYGAFSAEGFHQVMILPPVERPLSADAVTVEVTKWYAMTPAKRDLAEPGTHYAPLVFELPLREEYLDPAPEQFPLDLEGTGLGRTLRVDRLEVSVGQARLHGRITLLPGEHDPALGADLVFGDTARDMVDFDREPDGSFIATFEPPDEWPVPVRLKLHGIGFATEQVLEAVIPWGQFGGQEVVVEPADLVVMPFYDGAYRLHKVDERGVSFEIMKPDRLPRVTPTYSIPKVEFIGPGGETVTNMQTGGGHIGEGKQGVSYLFADEASPAMRAADEITVRLIHPEAVLDLDETWMLVDR